MFHMFFPEAKQLSMGCHDFAPTSSLAEEAFNSIGPRAETTLGLQSLIPTTWAARRHQIVI